MLDSGVVIDMFIGYTPQKVFIKYYYIPSAVYILAAYFIPSSLYLLTFICLALPHTSGNQETKSEPISGCKEMLSEFVN